LHGDDRPGLRVASVAHLYVDLPRLARAGPWLITLALLLGLWEVVTAKLDLLPRPFFATPQSLLEVYEDDWVRLGECTLRSVMPLITGYAIGATLDFVTGVAIGWSRGIGYWGHPVLRFIGPLPATAWLPLAFFAFPSNLERRCVSDRTGDGVSGRRTDLVRREASTPPIAMSRELSARAPAS
jgi:hypothetical protein